MNTPPVQCSQCGVALPVECLNQSELAGCPGCGALVLAEVFPALLREVQPGREGEVVQGDIEASCFYHPQKKAARPCDACGRFLCALCDCELNGQHFCPACLEAGRKKGKIQSLENHRSLHDSVALALATYPLLIFYFTIITAPAALFIALRHWNTPTSILRRTKFRLVVAIVLALLQLAGWGVGLYFLFTSMTSRS